MIPQILRTLDIAVSQDRSLRRSALAVTKADHPYALWRTMTDPNAQKVSTLFAVDPAWPTYLATRSTRLWPFSKSDRRWLVNWGYLTSDVLLRSWIWEDDDPPTKLPFEDASFAKPPPEVPPVAEDPE
jgi:hypothetical protein